MSILTSVKKLLGISEDDTHFDTDIMIHINSVFFILNQIGMGKNFSVIDKETLWEDYIDATNLELIKTYTYLKVKMLFDPPTSSAVIESTNRMINEFEWRIQLVCELKEMCEGEK